MKYAIKLLNKRKFLLCFLDAFLTNLCLYLVPVALSLFTKAPFTLEKLGYLILSINRTKNSRNHSKPYMGNVLTKI